VLRGAIVPPSTLVSGRSPCAVLPGFSPNICPFGWNEGAMVEFQPIRGEIEREEDGRLLASVPDLPGVMAYGGAADEAVRKVKAIALLVLADMIESGEDMPEPLRLCLPRECLACNQGQAGVRRVAVAWLDAKKQVGSHRILQ